MEKHLRNVSACAHSWAHALQPRGCASHLLFEGKTIYSYGYHFPIATVEGDRAYFTLRTYSVTTGHHKNLVLSAISHKTIVFVPEVPVNTDPCRDKGYQKSCIDYWVRKIRASFTEIVLHARKKSILSGINTDLKRLRDFIQAVGFRPDNKLKAFLESPSLLKINECLAHSNRSRTAAINRLRAKAREKANAAIKRWKEGLLNKLPVDKDFIGNSAYLRYNSQTNQIETSKNVEIAVDAAEKFWYFIRECLRNCCSNFNYQIAGFSVDTINENYIKIGCHSIAMAEVQRIAAIMKWD